MDNLSEDRITISDFIIENELKISFIKRCRQLNQIVCTKIQETSFIIERKMAISNFMTVIGLVNGMIGGVILILPLLAIKTGWLLILPITIYSGFVSYFTCLLCIRHLKNFKNLDVAIYHHFGKRLSYKIFYDVIIIVSMTTLLILYFSLICEQWAGIIGQSRVIPIINALILFPIVYVMKKYDFGATLLAYGILSIVGYVMFLIWLSLTTDQGPKHIPAAHGDFVDFAAALAQGFAIQTFFIPILKKNPNQKLYKKLLGLTYVIGTVVYCFIAYSGAYSIINRSSTIKTPQTIEDFFGNGSHWQVILLEIIYLVHLYSAFPQFLLIAKERFFSIFKWPQPKDVSIKEVVYVGVTIFLSLIVKLTEMSVTVIIELNGSIISFFFIYVIPIGLHLKCVYFTRPQARHAMLNQEKEREQENSDLQKQQQPYVKHQILAYSGSQQAKPQLQMQEIQLQPKLQEIETKTDNNQSIATAERNPNQFTNPQNQTNDNNPNIEHENQDCGCDINFKSKYHEYAELILLGTMLLTGLLIMGYTLYLLIAGETDEIDQT